MDIDQQILEIEWMQAVHDAQLSDEDAASNHSENTRSQLSRLIVQHEFIQAINYLKLHPEEAKSRDDEGWTALHLACMEASTPFQLMDELIEQCDVYAKDLSGNNAFHILCESDISTERMSIIELFLSKYPKLAQLKSGSGLLPLHTFLSQSSMDLLPLPSSDNIIQCFRTILKKHPKAVMKKCDESKMTPLHYACRYFIPNLAANDSLAIALTTICVDLIEAYPKSCRQKDGSWRFPLHYLCEYLNPTLVIAKQIYSAVIEAAPSYVMKQNKWGVSPFSEYLQQAFPSDDGTLLDNVVGEITEVLLKAGYDHLVASQNLSDGKWLPLHRAVQTRMPRKFLLYLIRRDPAELSRKDDEGNTPLLLSLKDPLTTLYQLEEEEKEDFREDFKVVFSCEYNPSTYSMTRILVEACPCTALLNDINGVSPLCRAITYCTTSHLDILAIVNAAPDVLTVNCPETKLLPFMLAAYHGRMESSLALLARRPDAILPASTVRDATTALSRKRLKFST